MWATTTQYLSTTNTLVCVAHHFHKSKEATTAWRTLHIRHRLFPLNLFLTSILSHQNINSTLKWPYAVYLLLYRITQFFRPQDRLQASKFSHLYSSLIFSEGLSGGLFISLLHVTLTAATDYHTGFYDRLADALSKLAHLQTDSFPLNDKMSVFYFSLVILTWQEIIGTWNKLPDEFCHKVYEAKQYWQNQNEFWIIIIQNNNTLTFIWLMGAVFNSTDGEQPSRILLHLAITNLRQHKWQAISSFISLFWVYIKILTLFTLLYFPLRQHVNISSL